jgi:hypothetical protein
MEGNAMRLFRRLALAVSMLVCLSVAFTAAAIATEAHMTARSLSILGKGGGPGFLPAGNYVNTNVFAGFNLCCSGPQLNINVDATTNVSNPLVGPSTSQSEVDVNFQACDFTTGACGAGCFIPDGASDFTSSSTSAVLKTTVTDSTRACQGNPVTGFTRPFTVSVTWTSVGSNFSSSGVGRYACGGYTSETRTTTSGSTATNATASTSLFPGSTFTVSGANLSSFDQRIHVQGTPLDACTQLGGKGAGGGPQPAGNYRFVSKQASLSIVPTDPSQPPLNVFVTTFTNVSSPAGGPTTTQNETDLNIFQATFPQSIAGCFIIPSSAFTIGSGLQSASLHASIDPTTQPCPQSINSGLPASFTANVIWTGTGPVATFKTDSSFSCASLHSVGSGNQSFINATATGGLSGIADSFSTNQAFIGTGDTTTHVQGTGTCF